MPEFEDSPERLQRLMRQQQPLIADKFMEIVAALSASLDFDFLINLVESGQTQRMFAQVELAAARLAGAASKVYVTAGEEAAKYVSHTLEVIVDFNQVNEYAVQQIRLNQLRMVRELTESQRQAVHDLLIQGVSEGKNPREVARAIRDSIGLTQKQTEAVSNYRRLLEGNSAEALDRELRDRRFDPSVRGAISTGTALSPGHIDRMVARYRERMLQYRAETIARTEALRAAHEGTEEMYRQAIEAGLLEPHSLIRTWHTKLDGRERDSHHDMNGQQRGVLESFQSPSGALLRYPGDPNAPAAEIVQCRCVLSTRFRAAATA